MRKNNIALITMATFSMLLLSSFNSVFADSEIIYQATGSSENYYVQGAEPNASGNIQLMGEKATSTSVLVGKTINRLVVDLKRGSNVDAGTLYIGVWDGTVTPTTGNRLKVIADVSAGALSTNFVTYTYSFSNYTIATNNVIGFFYSQTYPSKPACDSDPRSCGIGFKDNQSGTFNGTSTRASQFRTDSGCGAPNTWCDQNNVDLVFTLFADGAGGGTSGGIDCTLQQNVNLLTCRLALIDQTPLAGASQLTNQSATDISCQIGIIACTNGVPDNTNIQTNGVGYILLMVGIGIFVGLLWVASRGQLTEIPNFVWMVGTIAIVGAVTAVGWIDPTILIVSIITVIALAGIKSKNLFSGTGGMFKGEET